ncbi:MAG: HD domain-containing protein [Lachnospiraceae bacterium]|nr:HD domain-containing protein [Lachnospiraceae bacterium]
MKDKDNIKSIIRKYGRVILASEGFKEAFSQPHHFNSTVGDHTLGVTVEAVRICLRRGITDDITLKNVVTASLCHDLGILGRKDKFRNNVQCLIWHPVHSVKKYQDITGENDERVRDAILCHMFPLKPKMPAYREGWILVIADKIAAAREKTGFPSVTPEDRAEIISLKELT